MDKVQKYTSIKTQVVISCVITPCSNTLEGHAAVIFPEDEGSITFC
jgi:hypothetical protein